MRTSNSSYFFIMFVLSFLILRIYRKKEEIYKGLLTWINKHGSSCQNPLAWWTRFVKYFVFITMPTTLKNPVSAGFCSLFAFTIKNTRMILITGEVRLFHRCKGTAPAPAVYTWNILCVLCRFAVTPYSFYSSCKTNL